MYWFFLRDYGRECKLTKTNVLRNTLHAKVLKFSCKCGSRFKIFPFFPSQAQIIAQAIGQAFGVAYQQFLQANGIKASDLRPGEYSDYLENQELYNGDLAHFSDSQNLRDVSRSFFFLLFKHLR